MERLPRGKFEAPVTRMSPAQGKQLFIPYRMSKLGQTTTERCVLAYNFAQDFGLSVEVDRCGMWCGKARLLIAGIMLSCQRDY